MRKKRIDSFVASAEERPTYLFLAGEWVRMAKNEEKAERLIKDFPGMLIGCYEVKQPFSKNEIRDYIEEDFRYLGL